MLQSIQIRTVLVSAAVALVILPEIIAVSPPPDGGYPNANTAEGDNALNSLTTGFGDTAVGFSALSNDNDGSNNTGIGSYALDANTTGVFNTAVGAGALEYNATGDRNTAIGVQALTSNTTGTFNTSTGFLALVFNTSGFLNTANGGDALVNNTTGAYNAAVGALALFGNFEGNGNTATGYAALYYNNYGEHNIALGFEAGFFATGSNNIDIGNIGVADESNTIRIGAQGTQTATFVAGISGTVIAKGDMVVVDNNGQLGTKKSSARFKEEIKPMDEASEAILALKPVTFRYKKQFDAEGVPQFGLIAEEVAKVDPDLVLRDEQGRISTVRYDEVNAMLLNEFLKEHRKVQKLEDALAAVNERLKKQEAKIDKVSDKLESTQSASSIVANQ